MQQKGDFPGGSALQEQICPMEIKIIYLQEKGRALSCFRQDGSVLIKTRGKVGAVF